MTHNDQLLKEMLTNAKLFTDLVPNLNDLCNNDVIYFNLEETHKAHPAPLAAESDQDKTSNLVSLVPTFWSEKFVPENKKSLITNALNTIAEQGLLDIEDFCKCLYLYGWQDVCFNGLRKLYRSMQPEEQKKTLRILQKVAQLALKAPEFFSQDIQLLENKKGISLSSATFSREQCACLLANMFYCTFMDCWYRHKEVNLIRFFAWSNPVGREKTKFLLAYFEQILDKQPKGCVSFVRKSLPLSGFPNWEKLKDPICKIAISTELIEDLPNCLQVDFANKYIGGGVMNAGAVQEEIRFLMCPEMLVSLLLCPVMDPNEAIFINGAARFSDFSGYASKLKYEPLVTNGKEESRDKFGRVLCNLVAIDAISYGGSKKNQYDKCWIDRDLNKAYVGFETSAKSSRPVATGNWGCGAFRGDKQLKAMIQILAASAAGRDIIYSPFTEEAFAKQLKLVINDLERMKLTIGSLYEILLDFKPHGRLELFDYVGKRIME